LKARQTVEPAEADRKTGKEARVEIFDWELPGVHSEIIYEHS